MPSNGGWKGLLPPFFRYLLVVLNRVLTFSLFQWEEDAYACKCEKRSRAHQPWYRRLHGIGHLSPSIKFGIWIPGKLNKCFALCATSWPEKKNKKKKKTTEQERHHYTATDYLFQPLNVIKERDEKKIKLAKEKGITLLPIPCWWNGKRDRWVCIQPAGSNVWRLCSA